MSSFTGGCLCGRVRSIASGAPIRSHLCHCRDCQRYTGTAFASGMLFAEDMVKVEGELRAFAVTGTSGKPVHRLFCPTCGSGILVRGDVMPGLVVLQAGTLDDPATYAPAAEIYVASALAWVHAPGGFPRTRLTTG